MRDEGEALRAIVRRLKKLVGSARNGAITQLLTLAGLRGLAHQVEEELKKMPFMIDLTENEVFAREFDRVRQEGMRSGLIEGRVKGEVEGRVKGQVEASRNMVSAMIEKRFGPISSEARASILARTPEQLESLALRLLDARSIEDLLDL